MPLKAYRPPEDPGLWDTYLEWLERAYVGRDPNLPIYGYRILTSCEAIRDSRIY